MANLHEELRGLVRSDPWLMEILALLRTLGLPDWAVAGGAIRDRTWDVLHGREASPPKDVDVPYFDPSDLERTGERVVESALSTARPDVDWDVKNQAAVHLWFEDRFGVPIQAATSTEDGLSRWVETATCVGVRLEEDGALTVLAPLGLEDLLGLCLRPNGRSPDRERFSEHLVERGFLQRWERLRLAEGAHRIAE